MSRWSAVPAGMAVMVFCLLLTLTLGQHLGDRSFPTYIISQVDRCAPMSCARWDCTENRMYLEGLFGRDQETCDTWECVTWNEELCDKWNCTNLGLPKDRYHETCDVYSCTSWKGEVCETWDCTKVDMPAGNDKETCDIFGCTLWNEGQCRSWDCTDGDIPSSDDLSSCDTMNCTSWFDDVCRVWDCTAGDIPASNDRETCYRYQCVAWRGRACAAWDCVEDPFFVGMTRTETCFSWDCASWNITTLPEECACTKNTDCDSGCCAWDVCSPAGADGDGDEQTCLCRNGGWYEGKCCGDDFLESWCGLTGHCREGNWIEGAESFCETCRNGIWLEGACCTAGESFCYAGGRCEDGGVKPLCEGCDSCVGGRCEVVCDGTTCPQGNETWCERCVNADGDADEFACTCKMGEWHEGRCCGDDTIDEWTGEDGQCTRGQWREGKPRVNTTEVKALESAESCGDLTGRELNECLLKVADELSLWDPIDGATACEMIIDDDELRYSCFEMVLARTGGVDRISVMIRHRPLQVLIWPFLSLAVVAFWVTTVYSKKGKKKYIAYGKTQPNELSDTQFETEGLAEALEHLYKNLDIPDVLEYGQSRHIEQYIVTDFLNNEESVIALKKGMTKEEFDDVVTPRIYLMMGNVHFMLGDFQAARKRYERGIVMDRTNVALWNNIGLAFHHIGDEDKAEKALKKAKTLSPEDKVVLLNLGKLYGTRAYIQRTGGSWPAQAAKMPEGMRDYRSTSWDYGRYSKAANWGSPPKWREEFLEKEQTSLYDRQIEIYSKVLEKEPNNVEAIVNLGIACRHKGMMDQALYHLERVVALQPKNTVALYELARICEEQGETRRMIEYYRRCRDNIHLARPPGADQ